MCKNVMYCLHGRLFVRVFIYRVQTFLPFYNARRVLELGFIQGFDC